MAARLIAADRDEPVSGEDTGHKTRSVFDRHNIVSEKRPQGRRRSTGGVREDTTERSDVEPLKSAAKGV